MNDLDEYPEIIPAKFDPSMNRESVWKTKDGQLIAIKDMHDSHLLNTIRVLRDRSPIGTKFTCTDVRRRSWVNAMANEAYLRGLTIDDLTEGEPVHE